MGAARRAGSTGAVYAIEPDPDNYRRLRENLRLNRLERISSARVAMSDRPGSVALFKPSGSHSGLPSMARRPGLDETVQVEATTLDAYCEQNNLRRLDLLKVDVEGAELLVFRGGVQTLSSSDGPAILFEVNEETATPFGYSSADVKCFLKELGYEIFHYDGMRLSRVPVEQIEGQGDCFALKARHMDRIPAALV